MTQSQSQGQQAAPPFPRFQSQPPSQADLWALTEPQHQPSQQNQPSQQQRSRPWPPPEPRRRRTQPPQQHMAGGVAAASGRGGAGRAACDHQLGAAGPSGSKNVAPGSRVGQREAHVPPQPQRAPKRQPQPQPQSQPAAAQPRPKRRRVSPMQPAVAAAAAPCAPPVVRGGAEPTALQLPAAVHWALTQAAGQTEMALAPQAAAAQLSGRVVDWLLLASGGGGGADGNRCTGNWCLEAGPAQPVSGWTAVVWRHNRSAGW